jgi:hypothetical protein
MNQQDQDKMRNAHRATPDGYCIKCGVRAFNGELLPVEYPCDVIIVLNALELETYDMTGGQSQQAENVVRVDDEGNVVEPNYTERGINTPEAEKWGKR